MADILDFLYGNHLELLKMAANQNRKFDVLGISWGVLLIVGGGIASELWRFTIEDPWLPIVAPSNK